MTEFVDTYCPECDREVHAPLRNGSATLSVRGEDVSFLESAAVCPHCGVEIGDARIESVNLERAYGVYRTRHGIMFPGQIKALRASYGLSLREFSKFLGFGEQTAYRYERGDLPDQAHGNALALADTLDGARLLLSQNGARLTGKSIAKIEERIRVMEAQAQATDASDWTSERTSGRAILNGPSPARSSIAERMMQAPSAANGFRELNLERVAALAHALAGKCSDLYWTKLQKAAFFADMMCFERTGQSLTGLTYAHATYGPVIDRKEEIRYFLAEVEAVSFQEQGFGEVLVPARLPGMPFSPDELALIDEVAEFVNSFDTATELSDFSHGLRCWDESADGELIEYTSSDGEVGLAVGERSKNARQA